MKQSKIVTYTKSDQEYQITYVSWLIYDDIIYFYGLALEQFDR